MVNVASSLRAKQSNPSRDGSSDGLLRRYLRYLLAMTNYVIKVCVVSFLFMLVSTNSFALFNQTSDDLSQLEDMIRNALEKDPSLENAMVPMLIARPSHHWVESRDDFIASVLTMLKNVFADPKTLINCPDCDTFRLHLRKDQTLSVNNGELTVADMAQIKKDPRYSEAKSIATIAETPSGVSMRIVSLSDGRILFNELADSSKTLEESTRPWENYAEEVARRKRGESLSYVFINLGVYPNPLIQVEFLEQWGTRNQHISGLMLSLYNPVAAIGGSYHYMFSSFRRLHFGLSVMYPLENMFSSEEDKNQIDKKLVGQVMLELACHESFGFFASINNSEGFSVGVNFYNPLFMPFLF